MEQCKGLIAGIDIGYSKIQASVYSYNSRNVQTVKLTEDSKEKLSKMKLSFSDYQKVVMAAVELASGNDDSDENSGE